MSIYSGKNGHSNRVGFVVPCKICFEFEEGLSFFISISDPSAGRIKSEQYLDS